MLSEQSTDQETAAPEALTKTDVFYSIPSQRYEIFLWMYGTTVELEWFDTQQSSSRPE